MSTPTSELPARPPVVDRIEWERSRDALLALEKTETRARDEASAARRRLPMVEVGDYVFDGADGPVSLLELFGGFRQLIVQHFMFEPEWTEGCPSCSNLADQLGPLVHLQAYDITVARISRAPIDRLLAYNARMGWEPRWVSSAHSPFNRDFGWTQDAGEVPGVSVYLRDGDRVYQTYSTTGRGVESLSSLTGYLDLAPFGRQEDWQDSPAGWPQQAPHQRTRRKDEYGTVPISIAPRQDP